MAEILYGLLAQVTGGEPDQVKSDLRLAKIPVHLHFFRVFSLADLRSAIQETIRLRIRLVLHSQIFEFGGNGDGRGVFNAEVSKAVDAGIIWVNAAGNTGRLTYRSTIGISENRQHDDAYAMLPGRGDSLEVRCRGQELQEARGAGARAAPCRLRAILSWNSFGESAEQGTDKDLDLELWRLQDGASTLLERRALRQSSQAGLGSQGQVTPAPVEIMDGVELEPTRPSAGAPRYFLRVRIHTPELFDASDILTLAVSGDAIEMDNGQVENTIMNPADHPGVITVGAENDAGSAVDASLRKPELLAPATLLGRNGRPVIAPGNSNGAAMVAAGYAVLLAYRPNATRDQILAASFGGEGHPLATLGFGATGASGCFETVELPSSIPVDLAPFLAAGAQPVLTTRGTKLFMAEDPLRWLRRSGAPAEVILGSVPGQDARSSRRELAATEMLVVSDEGLGYFARTEAHLRGVQSRLRAFEVVQAPRGAVLCGANFFRLPAPADWL